MNEFERSEGVRFDGQPLAQPGAPRGRQNRRRWLITGGATAALLLALGVGVGLGANTLEARAAGSTNLQTALTALNGAPAKGQSSAPGGPGARHGRGPGAALTVTGVSGQTITAKRPDGSSVTVTVSSNTTYIRAGKTVSLSAITSGETIRVMGKRNSDGSVSATRVDIVLPSYGGAVTSVSGSTITVRDAKGTTHTIHTSAATTVERAGQASSLSAITTGAQIRAEGGKNSDGSLNAEAIEIVLPHAHGQVSAVSGSTITLKDPRGAQTVTIHVGAATRYVTVAMGSNGPTESASSLGAVKSGVHLDVEGTKNSDGSINAEVVRILPAPPAGAHGPNSGPHDGPNGGPMGAPSGAPAGTGTSTAQ